MINSLNFISKNQNPPKLGVGISIKDSGIYGAIVRNSANGIVIEKSAERKLYFKPELHHSLNTSLEAVRALKEVASELGVSRADIGIPTRHYYYRCIYIPVSPDNISQEGHFERKISSWIDDNTQLPNVPMNVEYDIVYQNQDGSCEVAVGLVPKKIIEHYRQMCLRAGIFPVTIGSPLKNLHNACDLEGQRENESQAMIDIDPAHSHLSIYSRRNPIWNHTIHHDINPSAETLASAFENMIKSWQEAVYESPLRREPLSVVFIHGSHNEVARTAKILNSLIGPDTKVFSVQMERIIDPYQVHNFNPDHFDRLASAIILAKQNLFLDL